jgi:hypothetical protein
MFDGITKLAAEGDEEGVRRVLELGTPVDIIDNGQFTAVHTPIAAGRWGQAPGPPRLTR